MGGILSAAPFDLIDFLFNLEGLEVVEFRLVRLEFCVELVLAGFFLDYLLISASCRDGSTVRSKQQARRGHSRSRYAQIARHVHPCHQSLGSCQCDQTQQWK